MRKQIAPTPKQFPSKLSVTILSKDIKAGQAYNCQGCPIALALKRLFPAHKVLVAMCNAEVSSPSSLHTYRLSKGAYLWRERFDRGLKVRPMKLSLLLDKGHKWLPC